jgi:hypothetical protein
MKQEPNELSEQIVEWMQEKISRLTRLTQLHNAFVTEDSSTNIISHWYPETHNMWTMGRTANYAKEPVKTQPCMFTVPDGDIEQQKVTRHEFKPWPTRTFQMNLEQAKQLRRQKQVAQSIIHGRFGMLIREKAAAKEFASTLDALLS